MGQVNLLRLLFRFLFFSFRFVSIAQSISGITRTHTREGHFSRLFCPLAPKSNKTVLEDPVKLPIRRVCRPAQTSDKNELKLRTED